MKICPNCGAQMGATVNFCTNCGTDLRQVPVAQKPEPATTRSEMRHQTEAKAQTEAKPQATAEQAAPQQNAQAEQPAQQAAPAGNPSGFQQAINNFDAHNMWSWFVNSWKHPTQDQQAEKWYGWVTLLVEDLLMGLGLFIGAQRGASLLGLAADTGRFSFGVAVEVMFFLALGEFVFIGAAYLSYKIIYGHAKSFSEFTNHVVQTSNLNAIFIVLFFLFMLIFGVAGAFLGTLMLWLALTVFEIALTVVVIGDANPVHDKFYGYFLFVVLQFIAVLLFASIAGGIIGTQIGSTFTNMIGQY
jgi:hypothetical protein